MTITRALLFCSLVLSTSLALAQESISLRRKFAPGQVEKFKVATKFEFNLKFDGESSSGVLDVTNDLELRYSEPGTEGVAKFEMISTNFKGEEEVEGERSKLEDPESYDSTYIGKVNPFMHVMDLKEKKSESEKEEEEGPDIFSTIFESVDLGAAFLRLPEKPVKPGDAWKFELDPKDFFKKGQFVEGTFRGIETLNGKEVLTLVYDVSFDVDGDMKKLIGGDEPAEELDGAKLTGTVASKRVIKLDRASLRIVESTELTTSQLVFATSEFSFDVNLKSDVRTVKAD